MSSRRVFLLTLGGLAAATAVILPMAIRWYRERRFGINYREVKGEL